MIYRGPISDQTWDSIRAEYTLAALEQVRGRLSELMDDPEPVMRQLVRVFIGEGPFCPGFQFLPGRAAPPHGHRACPARDGAENPAQLLHPLDDHTVAPPRGLPPL